MPDQIPSGSMPPEKGQASEETTAPVEKKDDGPILGKFKTPEDLAAAYTELEQTLGRQRQEIGDLRQQTQVQVPDDAGPEPIDFGGERETIQNKIEDGDISLAEGLEQLSSLAQQETAAQMEQKFEEYDQKKTADNMYQEFVNSNPGFIEMDQNGMLAEEMKTNPMHDKFSAYFAVKGKQDAQAAYEKGQEEALKLAKGADGTRSVLAEPGNQPRAPIAPKKGMGEQDKVAGMIAALKSSRV